MMEAIKNLSKYEVRTPFLLSLATILFVQCTGHFAIIYYAVEIFKNAGVDSNEHLAAIITAVVKIGGGVLGIFLVQKLPRVKLAIASMTVLSISMIVLGTVIYMKKDYENQQVFQVLPIFCVTLYMFSYGAGKLILRFPRLISPLLMVSGVGPIQWVFLGELLPPEYKVLSGIITSLAALAIFAITKVFPTLLQLLGAAATYWMFGSIAVVSNVFFYFFIPETKGKSLLEIQQSFSSDRNARK